MIYKFGNNPTGKATEIYSCNSLLLILILIILFQQATNKMDEASIHQNPALLAKQNRLVPLGFEKNYPKNIFIPIIEHLSDLGFKEMYEECVGTRELFEGKNVVSLAVIYQLITQKWFVEGVDRSHLLGIVCSKILVNSKIKKKIFHLKVAEVIINSPFHNEKDFRHYVSKQIAALATTTIEYDQLLAFPNLTIYLFHLMAKTLAEQLQPQPVLQNLMKYSLQYKAEDDDESESGHSKSHLSSKQEFRLYLKLIIKIFNEEGQFSQFALTHEKLTLLLAQKQAEFQEKYGLLEGLLNSKVFIREIAEKCLIYRQKGTKITNILLSEWIENFKAGCLKTKTNRTKPEKKMVIQQFTDHQQKLCSSSLILSHTSRDFRPIIIHLPTICPSNAPITLSS